MQNEEITHSKFFPFPLADIQKKLYLCRLEYN